MHANARGATTRHAPKGNGRIDARGKQAGDAPRTANGQPSDAGDAAHVHIGGVLHNLDAHRQVGILHANRSVGKCLAKLRPYDAVHIHRPYGEIGVISPRGNLEAGKRTRLAHSKDGDENHLV